MTSDIQRPVCVPSGPCLSSTQRRLEEQQQGIAAYRHYGDIFTIGRDDGQVDRIYVNGRDLLAEVFLVHGAYLIPPKNPNRIGPPGPGFPDAQNRNVAACRRNRNISLAEGQP